MPDAGAPSSPEPAFGQGLASDAGAGSGPAARTEDRAGAAAEAAAVAAYFGQMDAVAAEAKTSQDPQALARSVLDQALSGNMGSIDALIASQRSLKARMAQVVPPPSCREHHDRSVLLFARSVALLDRTRAAMTGQGTTDLSSVAVEGRAIEEEARAVDAHGQRPPARGRPGPRLLIRAAQTHLGRLTGPLGPIAVAHTGLLVSELEAKFAAHALEGEDAARGTARGSRQRDAIALHDEGPGLALLKRCSYE